MKRDPTSFGFASGNPAGQPPPLGQALRTGSQPSPGLALVPTSLLRRMRKKSTPLATPELVLERLPEPRQA